MSLFKSSEETGKQLVSKILLWGPQGAGKTHTGLTWPSPALVDVETRGRNFADRFGFQHAEVGSLEQLAAVFKELQSGKVPCESIIVDSASAIYYKFVIAHSKMNEGGTLLTDWVTVNRRFLACMDFAFSVAGKNVIFTAHAATKMIRKGRDFQVDGLKFVGDDRFRFAFDYIFRIEPKGDPTKVPAIFHVEKTSSPKLPLGAAIKGLDYTKFCEITRGAVTPAASAPAENPSDEITVTGAHLTRIEDLSHQLRLGQMQIADLVKGVTAGRTVQYQKLSATEADRVIAALEKRAATKGAA